MGRAALMYAKQKKIADCVIVQPGYSVKGALKHNSQGTHQVVMSKHLRPGESYHYLNEDELRIIPDRAVDKYLLQPGQILFMSRGVGNYAVLLEDLPSPAIATLTFFILTVKSDVDPGYLVWYLNQEPFQAQLNEIRTGAGTPMIPRREFCDLSIPLPRPEQQKGIAHLGHLMAKEKRLLRQLQQETEHREKLLGTQIVRSLARN